MKNSIKALKIGGVAFALTFIVVQENQSFGQNKPQGGQQGPPNFAQLLTEMDTDKDGKLASSEAKGPLKDNFSTIDTDGDGFITNAEFDKAPKPEGKKPKGKK